MSFFSTPKAPDVQVTPPPPQEDTDEQIEEREQTKQLSLERYLTRMSGLGANELRGSSGGAGIQP